MYNTLYIYWHNLHHILLYIQYTQYCPGLLYHCSCIRGGFGAYKPAARCQQRPGRPCLCIILLPQRHQLVIGLLAAEPLGAIYIFLEYQLDIAGRHICLST